MGRSTGLRERVHRQLDPSAWPGPGLSPANKVIAALVLAALLLAVLETEPELAHLSGAFAASEIVLGALFASEYALRAWSSAENPLFADGVRGRLRYLRTPGALLDLFVLVVTFVPFTATNGQVLRMLRVLGLLRAAKLGRYSEALRALTGAVRARRYELALTAALAATVMLVGAAGLWAVEGSAQPDKFGSIPRALWWAVVTLTTIGYGDVYPVTPLGKLIAGAVAIAGIGLIALPTGILASAFSDALQRTRR